MSEINLFEEWRNINGYLNYQVSNIGRVKNIKCGRIMKLCASGAGYSHVNLSLNNTATTITVHRLVALAFIPNPMNKPSVDHIDNTAKLNNAIENLRWATYHEQRGNTSTRPNTSSQYKGVYWCKRSSRWIAQIRIDSKNIYLGCFKSEEEAALAYNKAAIEYFGEFAKLNIIEHNQD